MSLNQEQKPILIVKNLSKSFPLERSLSKRISDWFHRTPGQVIQALQNISFSVYAKEIVGVLGESGSGKSTLARTLMGLYRPDFGEAELCGLSLFTASKNERLKILQKMQIIFQDPFSSLDPRMTIREILCEPLTIHGILDKQSRQEKLEKVLSEVGLETDILERYPAEFSGGQRQRIGICRALVLDPIVLIADEAVSALDVSVQAQILELLLRLKEQRNLSIIFISHDVAVVRQISDRILVLFRGHLVESFPADCLLTDAVHPYTQSLVRAALDLREGISYKHEKKEFATNSNGGCVLKSECKYAVEKCCLSIPQLLPVHPGHEVACWRLDQKI